MPLYLHYGTSSQNGLLLYTVNCLVFAHQKEVCGIVATPAAASIVQPTLGFSQSLL